MSKKEATGKLDKSKLEKLKAIVEVDDEREEAERLKNAELIDLNALAASTKDVKRVLVANLGAVKYSLLTDAEVRALKLPEESAEERVYLITSAMVLKANPEYTQETINNLPYDVKALLIAALLKQLPSFLPPATFKRGLKRTMKRREKA